MKRFFTNSYIVLLLVMLYAPIIIIAIFSFTESKVLGNWTGFSADLYTSLFSGGVSDRLVDAIKNTFLIASVVWHSTFECEITAIFVILESFQNGRKINIMGKWNVMKIKYLIIIVNMQSLKLRTECIYHIYRI